MLAVYQLPGYRVIANDGARDQLWEERDEAGEIDERAGRMRFAPIDVDRVAQGLEGEK